MTWLPGSSSDGVRVAYAVSRKVGGAVVRNRVKRRLREIVRELAPGLPSGAYLLRAAPEAATTPFAELRAAVSAATSGLDRP